MFKDTTWVSGLESLACPERGMRLHGFRRRNDGAEEEASTGIATVRTVGEEKGAGAVA